MKKTQGSKIEENKRNMHQDRFPNDEKYTGTAVIYIGPAYSCTIQQYSSMVLVCAFFFSPHGRRWLRFPPGRGPLCRSVGLTSEVPPPAFATPGGRHRRRVSVRVGGKGWS